MMRGTAAGPIASTAMHAREHRSALALSRESTRPGPPLHSPPRLPLICMVVRVKASFLLVVCSVGARPYLGRRSPAVVAAT